MSENLWLITNFETNSTKDIQSFIEEQISFLSAKTDGNVIAVFAPKRISLLAHTLSGVANVSKQLRGEYPVRGSDTMDASALYKRTCYEFYITDKRNQYELALFNLWMNDNYPVSIESIDSTIRQEGQIDEYYEINSFGVFESIFTTIIQTKKVQYIIWKLNQMMKEQDVLELEANQKTSTEDG